MRKDYKNVSMPEKTHAVLKDEAWRRKLSISKFLTQYAEELTRKRKHRPV